MVGWIASSFALKYGTASYVHLNCDNFGHPVCALAKRW